MVKRLKPVSKSVKAYVKKAFKKQLETKVWNVNQLLAVAGTNDAPQNGVGRFFDLSNAARGTGMGDRIGDQITPTSLDIIVRAFAGTTTNTIRWIVYQDKEFDAAAAVVSDILDTSATLSTFNAPISSYDDHMENRFHILHDELIQVDLPATGSKPCVTRRVRIPAKKMMKVYFDDGNQGNNAIQQMFVGSENAAGGATVGTCSRLKYKDA